MMGLDKYRTLLFMSSAKSVNLQKLCEVGTRTLLR